MATSPVAMRRRPPARAARGLTSAIRHRDEAIFRVVKQLTDLRGTWLNQPE
jgi:hypothetical protein